MDKQYEKKISDTEKNRLRLKKYGGKKIKISTEKKIKLEIESGEKIILKKLKQLMKNGEKIILLNLERKKN